MNVITSRMVAVLTTLLVASIGFGEETSVTCAQDFIRDSEHDYFDCYNCVSATLRDAEGNLIREIAVNAVVDGQTTTILIDEPYFAYADYILYPAGSPYYVWLFGFPGRRTEHRDMLRLNLRTGEVDRRYRGKDEVIFAGERIAYYSGGLGGFGDEFYGIFVNNVLVYPFVHAFADEDLVGWEQNHSTTGSIEGVRTKLPSHIGGLEYVSTSDTLFSLHLESADEESTDIERVLVSVSGLKRKGEISTETLCVTREVLYTTEPLRAILEERIPYPRRLPND